MNYYDIFTKVFYIIKLTAQIYYFKTRNYIHTQHCVVQELFII